jgi:hypothetical protein
VFVNLFLTFSSSLSHPSALISLFILFYLFFFFFFTRGWSHCVWGCGSRPGGERVRAGVILSEWPEENRVEDGVCSLHHWFGFEMGGLGFVCVVG